MAVSISCGDGELTASVRLTLTSLLAALALVLSYIETMIPVPVPMPGVKLGLSNIAIILALYVIGGRCAMAVAFVKVLASSLLFGSPAMFAYSVGGTLLALVGMLGLYGIPGVGVVAVSVVSAVLHNIGQLIVASCMLSSTAVFLSLPPLMVAACITGALTGVVASTILPVMKQATEQVLYISAIDTEKALETSAGQMFVEAIKPGNIVALIGENGSGKSTLARSLPNLLAPQRVCLAFQNPENQVVAPVVRDDVAFGLENEGCAPDSMAIAVSAGLSRVGLEGEAYRLVSSLSGGQCQQEVLAGLLVLSPDVLVLDEVTSMMDVVARDTFLACIRDLVAEGCAVVMITQHSDEAILADKIALMKNGSVVRCGGREVAGEVLWH